MKRIEKNYLSLLLILIALVGCKNFQKELCIATAEGDLVCDDQRKEIPGYFRKLKKGDIVTNPDDYERIQKEIIKREKACRSKR
jgi:hypothetical protein